VKSGSDRLKHARRILKHVIVPETQDSEAFAAEISVALSVGILVAVLTPIRFDDHGSFKTGEIDDVWVDDVLALEFERRHAPVAEHAPEAPLGRRGIGAHFPGAVAELSGSLAFVVGGHTPHPPAAARLLPSPHLGRGASHR
jgi:hypothetical protein